MSAALNDVERLISKTDFRNAQEVMRVNEAYLELREMLKGHAFYENDRLHGLLKRKHSNIHEHAEADHAHQDQQLFKIQNLIEAVLKASCDKEKLTLGYRLYLTYRKFVADTSSISMKKKHSSSPNFNVPIQTKNSSKWKLKLIAR